VTAEEDDSANPEGKYDWGSSTDCSWVPVSCPEACGTGVIGPGEAAAADGAAAAGADDDGVLYGTPLVAHPAAAASTPAATAETTRPLPENDDTVLPNPVRTLTSDTVPFRVSGPHVANRPLFGIMTLEHRRSPTAASG
jgi:hypothetical protein